MTLYIYSAYANTSTQLHTCICTHCRAHQAWSRSQKSAAREKFHWARSTTNDNNTQVKNI